MLKKKTKEEKVASVPESQFLELKGQLVRALADYDNLVKRVSKERADLARISSLNILVKLLPVLDNLESAQEHLKDQGLAISIGEFKRVLSEEGLEEIKPEKGENFDENFHEAIEALEGGEKGKVAETLLAGWKYKEGQVIRVAKVKVFN